MLYAAPCSIRLTRAERNLINRQPANARTADPENCSLKTKLLITGICGFVGSTIARAIASSGITSEITGIDNFSRAGSEMNRRPLADLGIRVMHGDIRVASDVESLPAADWVIDAAANPSVLAGVDGKTSSRQLIEHNLAGTINLLEYCKRHGAGLNMLSTSRVYSIPGLAKLPMDVVEDAYVPNPNQSFPVGITSAGVNEQYTTAPPVSLYGSTKVTSEHLALEYGETFGYPVWINRCGVMAGAGQFGHPAQGIFAYWIHSYHEKSSLKYIGFGGTGHQVRDCLHPRDLVALMQQQFAEPLKTNKSRTVNVSGGIANSRSLKQLSNWCDTSIGPRRIERTPEVRPFDIPWMVLDSARCQQTWDWHPTTPIESILEEISDFATNNPDWLALSRS